MTRKRFIKLLMSYGASRNEANQSAAAVSGAGLTYEQAHHSFLISHNLSILDKSLASLVAALAGLGKTTDELAAELVRVSTMWGSL